MNSLVLISAYLLDLILGDPRWLPHPVRPIGRMIRFLENGLRGWGTSLLWLKAAGILLAAIVCAATFAASYSIIHWAGHFFWPLGWAVSIFLVFTTLATRDLHVETRNVWLALEAGDIIRARRELSRIVGRETAHLDEPEILRALVETIAENISDGVIAPLFYFVLGGAPLAMTYKAINTLDSMVGYKNERFRQIGWASARLDDAANFFPARLSALLIVFSAFLLRQDWRESFQVLRRDCRKHESPNSAWPESTVAGALGVRLGGVNYYFGQPSQKPFIGNRRKEIDRQDVRSAWKILYTTSAVMFFLALLLV